MDHGEEIDMLQQISEISDPKMRALTLRQSGFSREEYNAFIDARNEREAIAVENLDPSEMPAIDQDGEEAR